MKSLCLNLALLVVLVSSVSAQNKLSKSQQKQGWKLLFDGKTTAGWHTYLKQTVTPTWSVVDGTLQLDPKAEGQGDLVTDQEYENYELMLDWNIAPGGNSGLIFGIHEDPAFHASYATGIEMQILDNKDAEDNKKANHLAGSLYDMKAPSKDVSKPAGQWNTIKLRKQNGHLTFWLNGTQTLDTQIDSEEWETMLNNSKFKSWKDFAKYPKGRIGLQDHGAKISFRNIQIRQL